MMKWAERLRTLTVVVGLASFMILAVGAALLSHIMTRSAYETIALVARDTALSLNHLFSNMIWPRYAEFVASAHQFDATALSEHLMTRNLMAEAAQLTRGTRILKFKIYDRQGLTVFSSRPEEIGVNKYSSPGLQAALTGHSTSTLEYREVFAAARGDMNNVNIVQSYLPIFTATDPQQAVAVLEVYTDVTTTYRQVSVDVRQSVIAVMAVFSVAFLLILYITSNAEREIERRRNENRSLSVAKQEAEMANRAKSLFLANMSHELRTPLNAIIGFTEMIEQEYYGPVGDRRYATYAGHVLEAGRHLLKIINDVLDLSKIEAGKMPVEPVRVDTAHLALSTLRLVEHDATAAGVAMASDIPSTLPRLTTDPGKLRQVLLNLLSNAIKFTPPGGSVTLTVKALPEHVVFRVTDTGVGIRREDLAKAMAPFGQIGHPFNRRTGGTGLGLPLSKQLVELMGGRLDIDSLPGKGTTVSIALPL